MGSDRATKGARFWSVSRARSLSGGSSLVERTAVACMKQQLAKLQKIPGAGGEARS